MADPTLDIARDTVQRMLETAGYMYLRERVWKTSGHLF
jgi:hypothetical protein